MHIVQTYLGAALDGGDTYVYYVAGGAPHQEQFTKEIEARLFNIGRNLGREVHLFGPHVSANDHISAEIIDRYGNQWFEMMNQTPGFLITRKPFSAFDPQKDEGKFVSLDGEGAEAALTEVERVAREQALWSRTQSVAATKPPSFWDEINRRVQITLNLGPISIGPR